MSSDATNAAEIAAIRTERVRGVLPFVVQMLEVTSDVNGEAIRFSVVVTVAVTTVAVTTGRQQPREYARQHVADVADEERAHFGTEAHRIATADCEHADEIAVAQLDQCGGAVDRRCVAEQRLEFVAAQQSARQSARLRELKQRQLPAPSCSTRDGDATRTHAGARRNIARDRRRNRRSAYRRARRRWS